MPPPHRDTTHRRLVTFYEWVVEVDVAEVTRLARTIDTWQHEVLAFFDTRASNGPLLRSATDKQQHQRQSRNR